MILKEKCICVMNYWKCNYGRMRMHIIVVYQNELVHSLRLILGAQFNQLVHQFMNWLNWLNWSPVHELVELVTSSWIGGSVLLAGNTNSPVHELVELVTSSWIGWIGHQFHQFTCYSYILFYIYIYIYTYI